MKETIICAFPGSGKSTIFNNAEKYGFHQMKTIPGEISTFDLKAFSKGLKPLFDSDSSLFDKTQFPTNYINHIGSHIKLIGDIGLTMFVSSHDVVREALAKENIPYILVYPKREVKEEWIKRYVKRGSPEGFIKLMIDNWDSFIDSCENDKGAAKHVVLDSNENITKVFEK